MNGTIYDGLPSDCKKKKISQENNEKVEVNVYSNLKEMCRAMEGYGSKVKVR